MINPFLNNSNFSKSSSLDEIPADLNSLEAIHFKKTLPKFSEEAVYIYSFKEKRMIYADGWEEVMGYKDNEITISTIENSPAPEFLVFIKELKLKALQFINSITCDLELYNIALELKKIHKNGTIVPVIFKIGIFKTENGKIKEIIGHCQINRNLKFGKIMQYYAYGPEKSEFEEILNKQLFQHFAISGKEKEAIVLVSKGYSFKQIAYTLNISPSAVEKRIIPLFKRFNVKSLSHLVSFAIENNILQ